jgi:glycosyltransferase involved in cell wall biosynthesis
MVNPTISVVIAAFNVEAYIAETMDSLLGQAFPAYEIIIVDDGSTDGTLALIESRYQSIPFVTIYTQDNKGVGAVREKGFELATGDYIFFCDPDDVVSPNLFLRLREAVRENSSLELLYFSKRSFTQTAGSRAYQRRDTAPSREGWYAEGTELLQDLILHKKYKATTWQYIFKKSMAERFNVTFKGRAHEDQLFSMNIYLHARDCFATKEDLYFQRVRQGSLTNSLKDSYFVWTGYEAYQAVMAVLKPHLKRFSRSGEVSVKYMRGNIHLVIDRCIKSNVELPPRMHSLTRKDARDCGVGLQGGMTLLAPRMVFAMRKCRSMLRQLSKRLRGRQL